MTPAGRPAGPIILALDVGTTGVKAVAFDLASPWRYAAIREYPLLERMIQAGIAAKFSWILVQFHLFNDGDRQRYEAIAASLRKTHDLGWRFPFVWELWCLRR